MKRSDLIWAICDIDEDLLRLTEEEPVMTKKHTRPLRIVLIAAAIAALLAGSVLAAYTIRHWDELFVQAFQVEDSDKELLDGALQDVYAKTTQDGVTCTVKQLLGTEHCLVVALDIRLPEDVETGTTSAETLKELTRDGDLPWEDDGYGVSVTGRLSRYFGYDADWTEFPDAPYPEIALAPVTVEKEALLSELDRRRTAMDSTNDMPETLLFSGTFLDGAMAAAGVAGSFGYGSIRNCYDPETRTLTELLYFHASSSLQDKPFTLVLHHLYLQSMATFFSPDNPAGSAAEDLLTSPIVLNFTANYQPQSQFYDILQEGTSVGTLELSPVSAHLTFPQEPDDPNRLAPNRHDYLKGNDELCIRTADGKKIELNMKSSGFTDVQSAFYIAGDIIDLTQVEEVSLGSFTLIPQE